MIFHRDYYRLESMMIIQRDVYLNLAYACAAVFVVIMLLTVNIQLTLWILLCVIITVVDVAGAAYFWGKLNLI